MTSANRGDIVIVKFATGILRTIKQEMIVGKLGELPAPELRALDKRLREILAL